MEADKDTRRVYIYISFGYRYEELRGSASGNLMLFLGFHDCLEREREPYKFVGFIEFCCVELWVFLKRRWTEILEFSVQTRRGFWRWCGFVVTQNAFTCSAVNLLVRSMFGGMSCYGVMALG